MSRFSSTPLLMPFSDHLWSHLIEQQQHGDPFFIHNWPLCPHQQQGRLQVNFYWNQQVVGGWMVCSTPTQNDCSSKWVHGLVDVLFSILEKKKKKMSYFSLLWCLSLGIAREWQGLQSKTLDFTRFLQLPLKEYQQQKLSGEQGRRGWEGGDCQSSCFPFLPCPTK